MLRSFGNLIGIAGQRQDDARPQHQGLVGMADVIGPAVCGDQAERNKGAPSKQFQQVLRAHPYGFSEGWILAFPR